MPPRGTTPQQAMMALLGQIKDDMGGVKERVAILQERHDSGQETVNREFKRLEERLHADHKSLTDRMTEDRQTMMRIDGEVNKVTSEVGSVRSEVAALTQKLNNTATTSDNKIASYDKRFETLEKDVQELKTLRAQGQGAAKLGSILWGVFGAAFGAGLLALLKLGA